MHRAVGGVLVGGAHGELVAVELAEQDGACGFELCYGGGVVGRVVALEDAGACGGGSAAHGEDVLDADGDACERAESFAGLGGCVDFFCLRECAFAGEREEAVDLAVFSGDALVVLRGESSCADAAFRNRGAGRGDGEGVEIYGVGHAVECSLRELAMRRVSVR